MNKKGIAPLIMVLIVASVLVVGGAGVYVAKNPQIIDRITGKAVVEQKAQELENKSKELETKAQELEEQIEELKKSVCRNITTPYNVQESYTTREPYTKTETYSEKELYTAQDCQQQALKWAYSQQLGSYSECTEMNKCLSTSQVCAELNWLHTSCVRYETVCNQYGCSKKVETCYLSVKNIDDTVGEFSISLAFTEDGTQNTAETQKKNIIPTGEEYFQWYYDFKNVDANSVSCKVTDTKIPTKQVCKDVIKYRDVPKTREVTVYRDVIQNRTVTKFKNETVCD